MTAELAGPVGSRPNRRSAGRERLAIVLALLALGGLVVLAATQTWSTVTVTGASPVTVTGQSASPALSSLGIVLFASAAAITIAGRGARYGLAVVFVLLGAAIIAVSLPGALDPASDAATAVTGETGVRGAGPIRALIVSADATVWPVVAAVTGVLVAVVGVVVGVRSHRWPSGGRRYRAAAGSAGPAAETPTDAIDEWDALTRGADPTDG